MKENQGMKINLHFFDNSRTQEIEERLAAISSEIETRGEAISVDDITAFETEVTALKQERKGLKETAERRTTLLGNIADGKAPGTVLRTFPAEPQKNTEIDIHATQEYRKAFMNYVLRGTALPVEYRANEVSLTTDVGAAIPTTILNQILQKLESVGMILPLVTRTAYKGGVSIPVSTAKPTATWVAEGAGSDKQKQTLDGTITFAYHKLRCAVAVSLEVDTMAIAAFETMLINNIVEAMTKAIEQSILTGTGVGQPKGILTETVPSGQKLDVQTLSYSDLVDAEAAIPQLYEKGSIWCMSKKTFMQFFALVDSNGQPIGRVNYGIEGKPERTLLGRSVLVCDYMPSFDASLTAGTVFAFIFNFKDYILNTNYAMGLKKYEDNDTDDIVTKAIMLVDGKTVDVSSLVALAKKA